MLSTWGGLSSGLGDVNPAWRGVVFLNAGMPGSHRLGTGLASHDLSPFQLVIDRRREEQMQPLYGFFLLALIIAAVVLALDAPAGQAGPTFADLTTPSVSADVAASRQSPRTDHLAAKRTAAP
ncbi:hypothetical protein [Chitinimonas naiadis]